MRISWGNHIDIERVSAKNGYGYATDRIINSLRNLGHEVSWNDKHADVHIHFDQPHHFAPPRKDMFSILYHPWESTQLKKGWSDIMNTADEVWTPSPLIAEWYSRFCGVERPVYVFEHGVDPAWTPKERKVDGTFKFLHCGAESSRKGAKESMQALRLAFPRNYDVELNLKIISDGWNIIELPRINIHNGKKSLEGLIEMFHSNHVYLYPSYGEGFGLTPLQAMATGMPTITVERWAPYGDFLLPELSVNSKVCKSPWPAIHPGNMIQPSLDSIIDSMRFAYDNYDLVSKKSLAVVDGLTSYYDWDRLTKVAIDDLAHRLNSNGKNI